MVITWGQKSYFLSELVANVPSPPQQTSQCEGKWKDSPSPPSTAPACPMGTSRTLGLVSCHRGWVLQVPNTQASARFSRARPASFMLHPHGQQTHPHRKAGRGPSRTSRTSSRGTRNCKTSGSDKSQGHERVRKHPRGGENPCILGISPPASTLTSFPLLFGFKVPKRLDLLLLSC